MFVGSCEGKIQRGGWVRFPEQKGSSMYCVKGESEKALHGSESGY